MFILFDIGGTKMRIAASKNGRVFGKPIILSTPKKYKDGIRVLKNSVKSFAGKEKIKAISGGVPFHSPALPDWFGNSLKKDLEKYFFAPVYIENDSALVGLGEAVYGAGKGEKIVAYITVSTGVGGVRIVDGHIDRKAIGFEIGKQIIDAPKTLEQIISGSAIQKRFRKKPYEVRDKKVWDELAKRLAYGLNNVIVHWSPDIIVVGGPMVVGNPKIPLQKAIKHLKKIFTAFPKIPKIKEAKLKDFGGLYGAMEFLKQKRK
jgi:glucokinase